jgi:hypothetical protein
MNSVITNIFLCRIGHFSTQINPGYDKPRLWQTPVITNKNGRSQSVRYNWVWLFFAFLWLFEKGDFLDVFQVMQKNSLFRYRNKPEKSYKSA